MTRRNTTMRQNREEKRSISWELVENKLASSKWLETKFREFLKPIESIEFKEKKITLVFHIVL